MGERPPLRRFGKYVLLDRLNSGGMAEVFLAKLSGAERFERLLAVKCMRPELAADEVFCNMFVDEANLAGQLNHANVAQIYELGRHGDQLYIAMELVQGRDLRAILDRHQELDEPMPLPFAAYVVAKAAEGLHYAHTRVAKDGAPLSLVHRDVSPRNLIVSYEGEVKLVDFGIAKARQRLSQTQVGQLKGKFGYMAPEQLDDTDIDRRADIFALGAVLYECARGEPLYGVELDFEVLEQVRDAVVPDFARVFPEGPEELLLVLERTLKRDPDARFDTAADLARALEPLLIQGRAIFGARDAADYMTTLFGQAREWELRRQRELLGDFDALDLGEDRVITETFLSDFEAIPSALAPVDNAGEGSSWTAPTLPSGEGALERLRKQDSGEWVETDFDPDDVDDVRWRTQPVEPLDDEPTDQSDFEAPDAKTTIEPRPPPDDPDDDEDDGATAISPHPAPSLVDDDDATAVSSHPAPSLVDREEPAYDDLFEPTAVSPHPAPSLAEVTPPAPPPPREITAVRGRPKTSAPPPRRHTGAWLFCILLLAAGAGGWWWFLRAPSGPPTAVVEEVTPEPTLTRGQLSVTVTGAKQPVIYINGKRVAAGEAWMGPVRFGPHQVTVEDRRTKTYKKKKIEVTRANGLTSPARVEIKF